MLLSFVSFVTVVSVSQVYLIICFLTSVTLVLLFRISLEIKVIWCLSLLVNTPDNLQIHSIHTRSICLNLPFNLPHLSYFELNVSYRIIFKTNLYVFFSQRFYFFLVYRSSLGDWFTSGEWFGGEPPDWWEMTSYSIVWLGVVRLVGCLIRSYPVRQLSDWLSGGEELSFGEPLYRGNRLEDLPSYPQSTVIPSCQTTELILDKYGFKR